MLTGLQWWERAIGRLWEMIRGVEEGQWEEREGGGGRTEVDYEGGHEGCESQYEVP
jgi:hypothetical protein